jgi:peptidoglycan-associated lipoprotein
MSELLKINRGAKMIRIQHILLFLLFMMSISLGSYAQNKEMKMADSAFITLQYNTAADLYQRALRKYKGDSSEKQYCTYMLAESYRIMNEPDKALPLYKELAATDYGKTTPVFYLRYAAGLKTIGDFLTAKEYFEKYLKTDPSNQEALNGLESCQWILNNQEKRLQVNVVNLDEINSTEDDFGPAFLDEDFSQVVFTSNRYSEKTKSWDEWTGAPFSDLYKSSCRGKGWISPAPLEFLGKINSEVHEGSPCMNHDRTAIYFTRCDKAAGSMAFCQIWKTDKSGDGWATPRLVLSDSSANIGQPTVSGDELTLIFSSDMKGSIGENDIWAAQRVSIDSAFGKPVLLDPVLSSSGDEVFPHLYDDTTLYFSSNGFEGYGGWDIFKSMKKDNGWSKPENLLSPVNSGYDDFGIAVRIPGEEGYFSSNRPGGKGGDDIYHFYRRILLFTVSGHVKDNMNLLSMEGVQVMLIRDESDTIVSLTDKHGFYQFDTSGVLEDHVYELIFKKADYFAKKESFSTIPYLDDYNFIIDMTLDPIPEKPIVLPDILYELDKWDLAPQYQDSLMQLVELLRENESLVIELRSHTDSRGSDEYNDALSQKRAQSVVDFLVSQGIEPGRLVAKGYGERIFRVIDKNITRQNYTFKAGTEMNDEFINSLPSKEIKEAAFQLNRRTEFAVLAKDFKPGSGSTAGASHNIQVVSDPASKAIGYTLTEAGKIKISGYINDYSTDMIIDADLRESAIDEQVVLDLLRKGAVDRNDFIGNFEDIMVDDRITENVVINMAKIRLGELVIIDSGVKVKRDQQQFLIIGKDLLDKTGDFIIDEENQQIIFK